MIPLPNREKFLTLLRDGYDIRNACKESGVSKSSLYRYFTEFPAFKKECDEAMELAVKDAEKRGQQEDVERLAKVKQIVLNRKQ